MTDLILDPRVLARRECEFCTVDGKATGEIVHGNTRVLCVCIEDKRLREILKREIKLHRAAFAKKQQDKRDRRNRVALLFVMGVVFVGALVVTL